MVASLPNAVRDREAWHHLTGLLRPASCDLHVATVPSLTLWGPTAPFVDVIALAAQSEARCIAEARAAAETDGTGG